MIKKALLWIFFIAKDASLGISGLYLIIFNAKSLIESIIASNEGSSFLGLISFLEVTFALKKGSVEVYSSVLNLFFP